jgi:hypothetical protein
MRAVALLLAVALVGCGNGRVGGGAPADSPSKAERAAAIAKELRANPDAAEATLEKHGVTQAQWTELLSEIAADEALTRAYEAALAR